MSSLLSTECKICYVPVLYSKYRGKVNEGCENLTHEGALEEAKEMIADFIEHYGDYCEAVIECRVVPSYK